MWARHLSRPKPDGTTQSPTRGLLDRYLVEHRFKRRENRKIQFTILAGAAARGRIEPDLLDEVTWWQTDDFWFYALAAAVAVIRASAERTGQPMSAFTTGSRPARRAADQRSRPRVTGSGAGCPGKTACLWLARSSAAYPTR